jgi:hypothetical protein
MLRPTRRRLLLPGLTQLLCPWPSDNRVTSAPLPPPSGGRTSCATDTNGAFLNEDPRRSHGLSMRQPRCQLPGPRQDSSPCGTRRSWPRHAATSRVDVECVADGTLAPIPSAPCTHGLPAGDPWQLHRPAQCSSPSHCPRRTKYAVGQAGSHCESEPPHSPTRKSPPWLRNSPPPPQLRTRQTARPPDRLTRLHRSPRNPPRGAHTPEAQMGAELYSGRLSSPAGTTSSPSGTAGTVDARPPSSPPMGGCH